MKLPANFIIDIMRRINSVIFDLDGTLVYFKIDFMSARREVIQKLYSIGIPKDLVSINQRILTTVRTAENYLRSNEIKADKIDSFKKQIDQIISKYEMEGAKRTSLLPGVKEILSTLKEQRYKIGLFTLENQETTKYILERFSIQSFFNAIITRDDVENYKPDPEHLNAVLSQMGVSANEIIVVGDNPIDLECARRINAVAVARYSERHSIYELKKAGADFIIKNLWELKKILKEINQD